MEALNQNELNAKYDRSKAISLLKHIQSKYPEQEIILDIHSEAISCKLCDANIFVDPRGRITIEVM